MYPLVLTNIPPKLCWINFLLIILTFWVTQFCSSKGVKQQNKIRPKNKHKHRCIYPFQWINVVEYVINLYIPFYCQEIYAHRPFHFKTKCLRAQNNTLQGCFHPSSNPCSDLELSLRRLSKDSAGLGIRGKGSKGPAFTWCGRLSTCSYAPYHKGSVVRTRPSRWCIPVSASKPSVSPHRGANGAAWEPRCLELQGRVSMRAPDSVKALCRRGAATTFRKDGFFLPRELLLNHMHQVLGNCSFI